MTSFFVMVTIMFSDVIFYAKVTDELVDVLLEPLLLQGAPESVFDAWSGLSEACTEVAFLADLNAAAKRGYLLVLHGAAPGTALAGLSRSCVALLVSKWISTCRILVWLLPFGWPGSSS